MRAGPGATHLPRGAGSRTKASSAFCRDVAGQGFRPKHSGQRCEGRPQRWEGQRQCERAGLEDSIAAPAGTSRGRRESAGSRRPAPTRGAGREDPGSQPFPPSRTHPKRCRLLRAGRSTTATPTAATPCHLCSRPVPTSSAPPSPHVRRERQDAALRQAGRTATRTGRHTVAPGDPAACPTATPQRRRCLHSGQAQGGVQEASCEERPALGAAMHPERPACRHHVLHMQRPS